jgi:hypothetical protein
MAGAAARGPGDRARGAPRRARAPGRLRQPVRHGSNERVHGAFPGDRCARALRGPSGLAGRALPRRGAAAGPLLPLDRSRDRRGRGRHRGRREALRRWPAAQVDRLREARDPRDHRARPRLVVASQSHRRPHPWGDLRLRGVRSAGDAVVQHALHRIRRALGDLRGDRRLRGARGIAPRRLRARAHRARGPGGARLLARAVRAPRDPAIRRGLPVAVEPISAPGGGRLRRGPGVVGDLVRAAAPPPSSRA